MAASSDISALTKTRLAMRLQLDMALLLGLIAMGWAIMALCVFDMLIRGVAGDAGLGMGVFAGISPAALSDSFGLPYMFSLCVSDTGPWVFADFVKSFLMWGAMVLAMMLPTRAAGVQRKSESLRFIIGYLWVWALGSVLAVFMQWGLHQSGLLDANMVLASTIMGAAILVLIGAFQLSPYKDKQLAACQHANAQVTGWQAGVNCLMCCGPLMLVMFVFGLMNVIVMAAMTGLILLERHAGLSRPVVKSSGVGLIVLGLVSLMPVMG